MSDETGNHGAPPEKTPGSSVLLIVLIAILTIGLIFLSSNKNRDPSTTTTVLAFIGLVVGQVVAAYRQEKNRKRIEEGVGDTRHLIRGVLNRNSLQDEDTQQEKQEQLATMIRIVVEEVRIVEREQFWTRPHNRKQFRELFLEVNAECRKENEKQIAEAMKAHVQKYHTPAV